jgi:hypothetical protein
MSRSVEAIAAEILAMPPAERFETVALMLRQETRPDIQRVAWTIAGRTVREHELAESLAELRREPSAERGLAAMRANLRGGS